MKGKSSLTFVIVCAVSLIVSGRAISFAQASLTILTEAQLARVVPAGFYFEGQSAPTQMRNAAAVRFGERRHLIAALVDTSGYSTDVRAKYEGFLLADAPVRLGDQELATGAYGFGFTADNRMNVFDISGKQVLSVPAQRDANLRRPRPLMMTRSGESVRLYSGRQFVVIGVR